MTVSELPTQMIDLGHLQVAFIESGTGSPLIYVHGGTGHRLNFVPLIPYFEDGFRTIAYDQRDAGETVNPTTPYTVTDLVGDLVAIIDHLGYERVHLMGPSYGSIITLHAVLQHPHRVASATLISSMPSSAPMFAQAQAALALPREKLRDASLDIFFTPAGRAADRGLEQLVDDNGAVARPPECMGRRMAAVSQHDVSDQLSSIEVPTLLVHGTDDPIAPFSGAQMMADKIPGAVLRPIEGGRHGVAAEFRSEVAGYVREFIDSHPI
jgi:pimeloyl-ACP methyl ester carboxylesterase